MDHSGTHTPIRVVTTYSFTISFGSSHHSITATYPLLSTFPRSFFPNSTFLPSFLPYRYPLKEKKRTTSRQPVAPLARSRGSALSPRSRAFHREGKKGGNGAREAWRNRVRSAPSHETYSNFGALEPVGRMARATPALPPLAPTTTARRE